MGDKALLLSEAVERLPVVADRGWNTIANSGPLAATLAWWLALLLLGWAGWPLCLGLCRGLPDRGYLLSKAVGWLLVGYVLWLGASNRWLANRALHVYAVLAVLLVAGAWAAYRQRRRLVALWRARRGLFVCEELLFSGAFLALVLVRLLNPDLWQPWFGGEKMMEIAYLNAIVKSAHFPPYDPYFAGGYINYYYYGLYLVNVLIKLTGIVPEVAFNLAVPTFFALTVGLAFSFGHAVTGRLRGRRWLWGGLAAAGGVALLGNLTVLVQWLANLVSMGGGVPQVESGLEALAPLLSGLGRWLTLRGGAFSFDYWYQATRIIPFTINEFPFFSYLFADLHPHMMSIPLTVAALVLVVGIGSLRSLSSLVLLALVVGALGPANTWDLPTYLGLVAVILIWRAAERGRVWWGLLQAAVVAALAYALYLPFYSHYATPDASLRLAPNHTQLRYFLVVWGLWLAALYGWLVTRCWRGREGVRRWWGLWLSARARRASKLLAALGQQSPVRCRLRQTLLAASLLLACGAALAGEAPIALLLPLLGLVADLWLRHDVESGERLAGLLAAAGCAILIGIELFYLGDFLQGSEWYRMNTVFKFGIQAWVLLALAAAIGLPGMLAWIAEGWRRHWGRRLGYALGMALLLGIGVAYVPLGMAARVNERFPGGPPPTGTLDGMAYMQTGVYTWPDPAHSISLRYDYEAIQWLLANVQGTPIIAEAPLGYYREGGMRVSSYTGLPTLLGAHQVEQRQPERVYERRELAERLYNTRDAEEALALLGRLHVQYVYVGQLEGAAYGPQAGQGLDELAKRGDLEVAYSNAGVVIYQVRAGVPIGH